MDLKRGINLGGFLSQCVHTPEHYESFITHDDIKKIAGMGFDHVRIPVDYNVLEEEDGTIRISGFSYIDRVIDWCSFNGLNAIIDLHKAFGYDFNDAGDAEANNLFGNAYCRSRFITVWERIAARYGMLDHVAFELLNEVVEEENREGWNSLIKEVVAAIRTITSKTVIIYGGIKWNSATTVKYLEPPADENIMFTFHFYEPLLFTHQKAPWVSAMDPDRTIEYPANMEYFRKGSKILGYQGSTVCEAKSSSMGPEFMEEMIKEATDAAKSLGAPLYCGEFGVIDRAPDEDTLRWFTDLAEVFKKHDIGFCVWSYKLMDFGITDPHYERILPDLLCLWNG